MRSLMPGSWRRSSARFNTSRTSRRIGSLTKSDMSPLKTAAAPCVLGCYGWRFLNEEIAVKDDAGNEFGHRLFVPVFFLADGPLCLFYKFIEFLF